MEIGLGNQIKTEQTQKQLLSTQVLQSLQILQFTSTELADYISEQMISNPLLEYGESDYPVHQMVEADRIINSQVDDGYANPLERDDYESFGDFYSYENPYSESYYGSYNGFETDGGIYDFGESIDVTLEEYLFNQIEECDAPYMVRATAAYIIQTLDENGYMTCTLDEISSVLSVDEDLVRQARELIWTFDPPGVAAIDVRESMKLQLKAIGRDDIFYEKLIDTHLEDLARGKFSILAKKIGVDEEKIAAAAELIRSLDPKPGSKFNNVDTARYIVPDIKVEKMDDTFVVTISEHSAPKLIIRKDYQNMMKDNAQDSDVTSFLVDRMSSAVWLIKSIERRKETMRQLVSFIIDMQHDFFEHGEKALKPVTMKEAAQKIGVNESTISRAVNGKYIQCIQGVYELKYFFSGGSSFTGVDGQTATAEGLKALIKKLIEVEDSSKPMSDQNISDAIMIKGIKISRRTVAKYREEMGIPGSSARRMR